LAEAIGESVRRISAAQRPVIVAGIEVHRFGLQDELLKFAEGAGIPMTATMLGKSVISERHPLFVGIYEGALGRDEVTHFVEQSDCVLLLGEFMTDINMGIFTANLTPADCIYATSETLRISHHHYNNVLLGDFIKGLTAADIHSPPQTLPPRLEMQQGPFRVEPAKPITVRRLIARLNEALDDAMVVIADPGDALFASADLVIHRQTEFISPAYYTSMGFAVPAALGVMVARPNLRPVVLVGDGAFQMTGMELSTIVRYDFHPIVIVLDNQGYGTERKLHPGNHPFNDIHPWRYHQLPDILGAGRGYEIRTEADFDRALRAAVDDANRMSLLHVHLDVDDCSPTLERLADKLSKRV
jgi:indolepyruvate decarboxylase